MWGEQVDGKEPRVVNTQTHGIQYPSHWHFIFSPLLFEFIFTTYFLFLEVL